jgi:hypothetical protein
MLDVDPISYEHYEQRTCDQVEELGLSNDWRSHLTVELPEQDAQSCSFGSGLGHPVVLFSSVLPWRRIHHRYSMRRQVEGLSRSEMTKLAGNK